MLPLLVLIGLGWLAWQLIRRIEGFPGEFAKLLEDGEVHRGPMSLLTGRSTARGTFQGRSVTLHFQRANEHQTGRVIVDMSTAVRDSSPSPASHRSRVHRFGSYLGTALITLEDQHDLRVEIEDGHLRARWQPWGLFLFPGRFEPEKWRSILAQMSSLASKLEAQVGSAPPVSAFPEGDSAQSTSMPSRANAARPEADGDMIGGLQGRRRGSVLVLKTIAVAMILVSLSILMASLTVGLATESTYGFALAAGGCAAFVFAASAAAYFLADWPGLLINERDWEQDERVEALPLGGWLWLLLSMLAAIPVWLIVRLSPLVQLSWDTIQFLDESGIFDMARETSEFSGVVSFAVVGMLAMPAFELTVALGIAVGALVLALLQIARSPVFPRTFLIVALLLVGLVASAQWATHAVATLTNVLETQLFSGPDSENVVVALIRYRSATQSAADTLTIAVVSLLIWIPTFFQSRRVRETFTRGSTTPT